jgi:hypothetical protein
MGMFDYVFCEKKLPLTKQIKKAFPNKDWTTTDFQTKSLDNTMTAYYIKKNGYLYTEKVEGEHVRTMSEAEEKKIKKQGKFCWPYKFVESSRTSVKEEITDTINFYDYSDDEEGNTWDIEFDAVFIKGKLKSLELVKAEIIFRSELTRIHKNFYANLRDERGDVPGWVLVVLMTTGLVTAIWTIAAPRLTAILKNSLDAMNGIR